MIFNEHSRFQYTVLSLIAILVAILSGLPRSAYAASEVFKKIVGGFSYADAVVAAPGDSQHLFVVELMGKIRIVQGNQILARPFLDLTGVASTKIYGQGLYDMAFDPHYVTNGYFYVVYVNGQGDPVLARYHTSLADPLIADPVSATILLTIPHPHGFHYGGQLAFGPDGYLYYSTGDGGSAFDRDGNAQNKQSLLGALLRIDVSQPGVHGLNYSIPADNPFIGDPAARPELWAKGLRNPWHFSFDRLTGDLYIADVGEDTYEEIDFQAAGDPGGENYGWPRYEGTNAILSTSKTGLTFPVVEYTHRDKNCAIIGGAVYRGQAIPNLVDSYLFADYCSGIVWRTSRVNGQWTTVEMTKTGLTITAFGEDNSGELYAVDFKTSALYKLSAN